MTTAEAILEARVIWTHALLTRELVRGRDRGYLDAQGATDTKDMIDPAALRTRIATALDRRPSESTPMALVASRFGLDDLEEDALWLIACPEIEPQLARFVEVIATTGMQQLSVQHVLRMIGVSAAALDRLARLGLLELDADHRVPMHRRKIRVVDRILRLMQGEWQPDPRLAGLARLVASVGACNVPPSLASAARRADDVLVLVLGTHGTAREELLIAASPVSVLHVQSRRLSQDPGQRSDQLRAIVVEARLANVRILFAGADQLLEDDLFESIVAANVVGPILATASAPGLRLDRIRPTVIHAVEEPGLDERRQMWTDRLPAVPADVIETCVDRYRIPAAVIGELGRSSSNGDPIDIATIQRFLRDRLDQRLTGFAKRVEWRQTWDDLVLPVDQFDLLVEFVSRVRHRRRVMDTWGFGAKVAKGTGTTALFSGAPGTGKTMIAGLLARELGLDLYQADLSKLVSKYIGETEQRLAELFDAAEHGQSILLFDEADSLFGKRTEVRSSNDRYANLETNYLLQRLESFNGICILTTNHETAIDPAFLRRLSVHVRVPMPDEEHREKLWQAMIPPTAETTGDIAFADLAREFTMSGGYIKNAVVRAAYLAAADNGPIASSHFWRAARAEYEGMGKVAFHGVHSPAS